MFRLAALLVVISTPAWAERAFPITWDSATIAAGTHEFQTWVGPRFGRVDSGFTQTDLRFQAAQGISDRVDTLFGFDADIASFDVDGKSVDARISNTWRYSLLRANDVLGLAFLGRLALGVDNAQFEFRVILDKQIGALLFALNASAERARLWSGRTGIDTRFDETLGLKYQVTPSFSLGAEFRAHQAFETNLYQGTGFYGGPTFNYVSKRWWFTFGFMAQVAGDKAVADRGNGEPLELRDNERFTARVIIGINID